MSRAKRPTQDYLAAARDLMKFVPAMRKYSRRKKLKPQEKSAIALKERALAHAYNLQPVTPRQAKQLKDVLYTGLVEIKRGPRKGSYRPVRGINAIQLSNTGEKVSIKVVNKNMFVTTNGRTWVYKKIPMVGEDELEEGYEPEEIAELNQGEMIEGARVFDKPIREAFPVEKIIKLAERAFDNPTVKMIGLWTDKGRVGEGFRKLSEFVRWVLRDFSTYLNVERWVNGIAILIADVGDPVSEGAWNKYDLKKICADRAARRNRIRKQKGRISS